MARRKFAARRKIDRDTASSAAIDKLIADAAMRVAAARQAEGLSGKPAPVPPRVKPSAPRTPTPPRAKESLQGPPRGLPATVTASTPAPSAPEASQEEVLRQQILEEFKKKLELARAKEAGTFYSSED